MDSVLHCVSPLGDITLASDGERLVGLWFDGQKHFAEMLDARHIEKLLPVFEQAARWLDIYFSGREPDFTPPLFLRGTNFRKTVWKILLTILRGQTMIYGDIAVHMGLPRAEARVVGGAVGHDPISIIIPCHRGVGADGSLTGYAGGVERKRRLLELER